MTPICENKKCENVFGVCIKDGDSVPFGNQVYQLASGNLQYCDQASNCKCFKPKCKRTKTCKQKKGQCFSKKIVPNGWQEVKKNGKHLVCNKALKCYCYKKSGKMYRDLDGDEYQFETVEDYNDEDTFEEF